MSVLLFFVGWIISGLIIADAYSKETKSKDFNEWLLMFFIYTILGYIALLIYLIEKLSEYLKDKGIPERYRND